MNPEKRAYTTYGKFLFFQKNAYILKIFLFFRYLSLFQEIYINFVEGK